MPDEKRALTGAGARRLAELCDEAVMRHGSDWPAIEKYIADRLQDMDVGERSLLILEVREVLKFVAPMRRSRPVH